MDVLLVHDITRTSMNGIIRHCYNISDVFCNDKEVNIVFLPNDIVKQTSSLFGKAFYKFSSLNRFLKTSSCHVVHIHGFASLVIPELIILSKIHKKKIVYTAHYHPFKYLRSPQIAKCFFYLFIRPFLGLIDIITTINKEDTAFFRKYHNSVCMIPNWIDASLIPSSCTNKKRNMLLFIGRVDTNKGIEHLYSIPKGKYDIHCVLNKYIHHEGWTVHTNINEQKLRDLYEQAALVIIPSKYEAFSYVALEALLHRTPIVISDRVRIADYVSDCAGVTVFEYGDMRAFNQAIDKQVNGEVDNERIQKIFDINSIKEKLKNIYIK